MKLPIRTGVPVVAAGMMVALMPGMTGSGPAARQPDLRGYYQQRIQWTACEPKGAQCGRLRVPLDYAHPGGGEVQLALLRFQAQDPVERLGSLVINYGGPGGSGTETLAQLGPGESGRVKERYDVVSFDPRGVGKSEEVRCRVDGAAEPDDQDESTIAAIASYVSRTMAVHQSCKALSGRMLPWVGTANAARDLDVLRQALGDKKLNYLGYSYGSRLGAAYAHAFPTAVGRMVLDGIVDPAYPSKQNRIDQAAARDTALRHAVETCLAGTACPLGTFPGTEAAMSAVSHALEDLAVHPLRLADGQELGHEAALDVLTELMYSRGTQKDIVAFLTDVMHRTAPQEEVQEAEELQADDPEPEQDDPHTAMAMAAINCRDNAQRYTPQQVADTYADFTRAAPVFGISMVTSVGECTGWPQAGDNSVHDVSAPGAPTILLVDGQYDPATPATWTARMAKALEPAKTITVTDPGTGHGLYGRASAPCINKTVEAFLFDARLPQQNTTCT